MDINKLRQKAKNLEPVIRIGKKGLTKNVFLETEKLLKKRKLIKIKILNNCPIENKKEIIDSIVKKTNSVLVSKIGNVFSIYRNPKKV
jgi:RNA-binding protein